MKDQTTVNFQITVSNDVFQKLMSEGLVALSAEDVKSILVEALSEFLKSPDGKKLFYESPDYYSRSSCNRPSEFLLDIVKNSITPGVLNDYADEFIMSLKEHYPELIREAFIQVISNLFLTEVKSTHFSAIISELRHNIDDK